MTTQQIANKLADYCKKGKWAKAQKELYADNVWSEEPAGLYPRVAKGMKQVTAKGEAWAKNAKVYKMEVSKPLVAGNWITMKMTIDSQWKGMPRTKESELCLYQVKNGKIVSEQFFYDTNM